MFLIAGTALCAGLDLPPPNSDDLIVSNFEVALVIILTGAFTTVVAAFGYKVVELVSYFLTLPMFAALGYIVIKSVSELSSANGNASFADVSSKVVYNGVASEGQEKLSFIGVVLLAFIQDQIVHLGMLDLTLLRFAKTANAGWMSAFGMYLGHYFLWIGAGFLFQANVAATGSEDILPGPAAWRVAGVPGLLAILFAGWSTANPFLYAGGLALKSAVSIVSDVDVSSRTITAVMGVISTILALLPIVVNNFLQFLAFAGGIITPVGAVVFTDTFILPRMKLQSEYSFSKGRDCQTVNLADTLTWVIVTIISEVNIIWAVVPFYWTPVFAFPMAMVFYIGLGQVMLKESAGGDAVELQS